MYEGEASVLPITASCQRLLVGIMGVKCTVSIDSSICSFGNVEQMRPLSEVGKVEVQVIRLGQRVEIGGVELEDVHCVEGTQRSHFDI